MRFAGKINLICRKILLELHDFDKYIIRPLKTFVFTKLNFFFATLQVSSNQKDLETTNFLKVVFRN